MTESELIAQALEARKNAYAPYSGFKVGAALQAEDGRIFLGANVENISFGLTMCAERVAVGSAVLAGVLRFRGIAIASDSAKPVVPCGACRQVLAEFAPTMKVVSSNLAGRIEHFTIEVLLPMSQQGILR